MEGDQPYIILFTYDANDHALKFPLKAEVKCSIPGVYTITNIRQVEQNEGSLLPPIRLKKSNGTWVFLDNGKESNLSVAIGRAIDERMNGSDKNTAGTGNLL